MKGNCWSWRWF